MKLYIKFLFTEIDSYYKSNHVYTKDASEALTIVLDSTKYDLSKEMLKKGINQFRPIQAFDIIFSSDYKAKRIIAKVENTPLKNPKFLVLDSTIDAISFEELGKLLIFCKDYMSQDDIGLDDIMNDHCDNKEENKKEALKPNKEELHNQKIKALIEDISSKTPVSIVEPSVTLDDYVCDPLLKKELISIKNFFVNRKEFQKRNIELPKGYLFKGVPGTGKTYAVKCIAGSIDCYFMSTTASACQGIYIGSGAKNIKNIFDAARKLSDETHKGVLLFLDEIESFGSRGTDKNNTESDRTINQLLAEMSGISSNSNIMIVAATNYPEKLDDALLRSGRFGKQIEVNIPDNISRFKMLKYYFNKINMSLADTNFVEITNITKGLTPADISQIANSAAILALSNGSDTISIDNINEAIDNIITKNIKNPDGKLDINLVSAHEAGHTVAEMMFHNVLPIKVTSYSYGSAGGFTQSGFELNNILTKDDFLNEIKVLLAGRAAEELVLGYITSGASNDLAKAKKMLYSYYKDYNFEEFEYKELDQVVLNKLNEVYSSTKTSLYNSIDTLKGITEELNNKRVLYAPDLKKYKNQVSV